MSQKAKAASGQPVLLMSGDVARQIRQHARGSPSAEICGVLIGQDRPGKVEISACIAGANAEEAGAHVTFTQDTWEHIYQIKDKEYPNERIVGWYHSHPGFGVFLSEHDAFIQKNFFASPGQVAWVFDPHSDEEGCFGWVDGRIERLHQVTIADRRGGERVQESASPEPTIASSTSSIRVEADAVRENPAEFLPSISSLAGTAESSTDSLLRLTTTIFTYLTVLVLGFLISWYLFPRVEQVVVPVPIDPMTGKPLPGYSVEEQLERARSGEQQHADQGNTAPGQSSEPNSGAKEDHGQPK